MAKPKRTQTNFEAAAKALNEFTKLFDPEVGSGLRVAGEEMMADIKASRQGAGVPRDTGALAATGRVEGPTYGEVILSFGGPAAPYALYQHEMLDLNHTVGEARYLVRGLERWRPYGSAAIEALKKNAQEGLRRAKRKNKKPSKAKG